MRKTNYDSRVEFFRRVQQDDQTGCWIWLGGYTGVGYGVFGLGNRGKKMLAHVYALTVVAGKEIPETYETDHLCRNPGCVNPAHLQAVPKAENMRRGFCPSAINARKVVCIRGHAFSPENTIIEKNGHRRCRICKREKGAIYSRNRRHRSRQG